MDYYMRGIYETSLSVYHRLCAILYGITSLYKPQRVAMILSNSDSSVNAQDDLCEEGTTGEVSYVDSCLSESDWEDSHSFHNADDASIDTIIQPILSRYYGNAWTVAYKQLQSHAQAYFGSDFEVCVEDFLTPVLRLFNKIHSVKFSHEEQHWPFCVGGHLIIHLTNPPPGCLADDIFYIQVHTLLDQSDLVLHHAIDGKHYVWKIPETYLLNVFTMNGYTKESDSEDLQLLHAMRNCLVDSETGIQRMDWRDIQEVDKCDHVTDDTMDGLMEKDVAQEKGAEVYKNQVTGDVPSESGGISGSLDLKGGEDGTEQRHFIKLNTPHSLMEVDQELLHSGIAILPGCRDVDGAAVLYVFTSSRLWLDQQVSSSELARLIMFYHTIPSVRVICDREATKKRGLTIVVDVRGASTSSVNTLLEALYTFQSNVVRGLSAMLFVMNPNNEDLVLTSPLYHPTPNFQITIITSKEMLFNFVDISQVPSALDGYFPYQHDDWLKFRKKLEPFSLDLRAMSQRLIEAMMTLTSTDLHPITVKDISCAMQQQEAILNNTMRDPRLLSIQSSGPDTLRDLAVQQTTLGHSHNFRESLAGVQELHAELEETLKKLMEVTDARLHSLERSLHLRQFEEDCQKILEWLKTEGHDILQKYRITDDSSNLKAIRIQQRHFEMLYFSAMTQVEKGNDLVAEAAMLDQSCCYDDASGCKTLARQLKRQLTDFTGQLEASRESIEGTARCYSLLDKSYEWALDVMRYVASMKTDQNSSTDHLRKLLLSLDVYLMDHPPPITHDMFGAMLEQAERLNNRKLLEQCKVAKTRCVETSELLKLRHKTLTQTIDQKSQLNLHDSRSVDKSPQNLDDDGTLTSSQCHIKSSRPLPPLPVDCLLRTDIDCVSSEQQTSQCANEYSVNSPRCLPPTTVLSMSANANVDNIKEYDDKISPPSSLFIDLPSNQPTFYGHHSPVHLQDNLNFTSDIDSSPYVSRSHISMENSHVPTYHTSTPESRNLQSTEPYKPASPIFDQTVPFMVEQQELSDLNDIDLSVAQESADQSISARELNCNNTVPLRQPQKKSFRRSNTAPLSSFDLYKNYEEPIHIIKERHGARPVSCVTGSDDSLPSMPEEEELDFSCLEPDMHRRASIPMSVNTHLRFCDAAKGNPRTLSLIMREMVQTEKDYVTSLEYIIDNYIPELTRDDVPQGLRGKRNLIFGNIEKIFEFHRQYFLSEIEYCEKHPFLIANYFILHESHLHLYALYNKNKPKSDQLMSELGKDFFRRKQLELGDKMDLSSYLLKPVQRMGKYALLLKQMLKECGEKDPEYQDLKRAEEMVKFQLRHGNDLLAMDSIRNCDVNLPEQGRLLRQEEFLVWQGRRKTLRHVFLFEDLILFSKARQNRQGGPDQYIYKYCIKTSDIGLTENYQDSRYKFEIWFRRRKTGESYILQAPNIDVKNAWIKEISCILWKQAIKNRELRLTEMATMGIGSKPCMDIKPSADNINDRFINISVGSRLPGSRNSIAVGAADFRTNKRPHSVISVGSTSSSSSTQSATPHPPYSGATYDHLQDYPAYTRASFAASSNESGICADLSYDRPGTRPRSYHEHTRPPLMSTVVSEVTAIMVIVDIISSTWKYSIDIVDIISSTWKHSIDIVDIISSTWKHSLDIGDIISSTWKYSLDIVDIISSTWKHSLDIGDIISSTWKHSLDIGDIISSTWKHPLDIGDIISSTWKHSLDIGDIISSTWKHSLDIGDIISSTWKHSIDIVDVNTAVPEAPVELRVNTAVPEAPVELRVNTAVPEAPVELRVNNTAVLEALVELRVNTAVPEAPVELRVNTAVLEAPVEPRVNTAVLEAPVEPRVNTAVLEAPVEPRVNTAVLEAPVEPYHDVTSPYL